MTVGAGGPSISREGVDSALERLRTERDSISAALLDLEDHPGHRLLDGAELTGVTRTRWTRARERIGSLWQMFDLYRDALGRAEDLRARHPRPGPAELAELTRLIGGAAVELPGEEIPLEDRSLVGPARTSERLTLDELVARMNDTYALVTEVVAAADAAWTRLLPPLARADETARAVAGLLRALESESGTEPEPGAASGVEPESGVSSADPAEPVEPADPAESAEPVEPAVSSAEPAAGSAAGPAGRPAAAATDRDRTRGRAGRDRGRERGGRERAGYDRAVRELAGLRAVVRTDPLSLVRDGAADAGRIDRIEAELTALRGELAAAVRVKAGFAAKAGGIGAVVERVEAAQAEALRARERVLARIDAPALPEVPELAQSLRDRLASLGELHRQGRWIDLAKRLSGLESVAADALDQMCATLGAVTAPLHRRDELRGRLEAYGVKAARLGFAEDAELARLHRHAHDLLWTAPCDLREATMAVRAYQEAIGGRQHQEREPGGP